MPTCLQYGLSSVIRFDLPETSILLDRRGPTSESIDDPAAAVAAGLANPINFPAIEQVITPEDNVALVLAPGVPGAEAILAGAVYALMEAGVEASRISIVYDAAESSLAGRDIAAGIPPAYRQQVQVIAHDSAKREKLAYLAANSQDEAVYFQRNVAEADVVIPIVCLRGERILGQYGIQSEVYPKFADESAQQRFFAIDSNQNPTKRQLRIDEAEEAIWLLGVMLCIGVLPADGGGALDVLVGERSAVAKQARQMCEEAWEFDVPERADLVIATIAGGVEQQTWENVGRALDAASRAVSEEGAIVICCELDQPPRQSIQRLAAGGTNDEVRREVGRDCFPDTLAADKLAQLSDDHSIYFRSKLDPDVVESLGLAYVASDEEIVRLSSRYNTCSLIGNAQFAMPKSDDEVV